MGGGDGENKEREGGRERERACNRWRECKDEIGGKEGDRAEEDVGRREGVWGVGWDVDLARPKTGEVIDGTNASTPDC